MTSRLFIVFFFPFRKFAMTSFRSNGDSMTTAPSETMTASTTTAAEVIVDQPQDNNDGNNNEANDTNNNVGAAASSSAVNNTSSASTTTDTMVTCTSTTSTVPRPPALPPRPPNLVLPHAGAVPRPPQLAYTIMQQGRKALLYFLFSKGTFPRSFWYIGKNMLKSIPGY